MTGIEQIEEKSKMKNVFIFVSDIWESSLYFHLVHLLFGILISCLVIMNVVAYMFEKIQIYHRN
jgi:hypothetical protein